MIKTRILLAALLAVSLFSGSAFADPLDAIFDFDALALNSEVPFSLTNGGITASFSSDASEAFTVVPAFFYVSPFAGNALADTDSLAAHPLNIQFSRALGFVTLDFALDPPLPGGSDPILTLQAFLGGTLVGSNSAPATFSNEPAFFPQGSLSFGGAAFDRIVLSSTQNNFAVDNIGVSVPEPATILLLSAGLLGIGLVRRKATLTTEN